MPTDPVPLTTDEIAGWLGIEPGARLHCPAPETRSALEPQLRQRQKVGCGVVLAGVLVSTFGLMLSVLLGLPDALGGGAFVVGFIAVAAGSISMAPVQQALNRQPWLIHGDSTIVADVTGLQVSDSRARPPGFVPWTSIASLEPLYGAAGEQGVRTVERWKLHCDDGRSLFLRADAPHAERLLEAARQVVAARQQGRPIWDAGSVPETGLSRMSGEEPVSDTSLSRADEVDA